MPNRLTEADVRIPADIITFRRCCHSLRTCLPTRILWQLELPVGRPMLVFVPIHNMIQLLIRNGKSINGYLWISGNHLNVINDIAHRINEDSPYSAGYSRPSLLIFQPPLSCKSAALIANRI